GAVARRGVRGDARSHCRGRAGARRQAQTAAHNARCLPACDGWLGVHAPSEGRSDACRYASGDHHRIERAGPRRRTRRSACAAEALRALRESEHTARIPILVLTAKDVTAEERARLNSDVSAILTKTDFSATALLAELRRAIAGRPAG